MPKRPVAKGGSTRSSRASLKASPKAAYSENVFVNCPFDEVYDAIFQAIVFAIHDCGFIARCALEASDSGEVRIEKILDIIDQCKFGVHDISRTELGANGLPRFNMPLELGLFLGARRWAKHPNTKKVTLILDSERHRYQKFCSDIAGQDIEAHQNNAAEAIKAVRNWLRSNKVGSEVRIPGGTVIAKRYERFKAELPELKRQTQLSGDQLIFVDYISLLIGWLRKRLEAKMSETFRYLASGSMACHISGRTRSSSGSRR